MVGVDFISLPEPAIFARGGGGMFYNQVRWLEIRAILSNLVPSKPGQAQSRLPPFLPLSQSIFFRSSSGLSHFWTRALFEEWGGCPRHTVFRVCHSFPARWAMQIRRFLMLPERV